LASSSCIDAVPFSHDVFYSHDVFKNALALRVHHSDKVPLRLIDGTPKILNVLTVKSKLGSVAMSSVQRRAFERQRCYRSARFVYNNGRCSLDSVLRNISPAGAFAHGVDMRDVPENFELIVLSSQGAGNRRRARRVWANGEAMGVAFLD
jgi:hypothetical protein